MKKVLNLGLFLGILVTQFGCSVAPIQNYHSASSLGAKKNELKLTTMAPGVSYDRGLSENLDVGVGLEMQSGFLVNARFKYALINQKRGLSLAAFGGAGYSDDLGNSKSVYGGPIVSYRFNSFELFASYRYNHVNWNNKIDSDDRDDLFKFVPNKMNFTYRQADFGMTFYGQTSFLTLGARAFIMEGEEDFAPVVDFGFHF